MKKNYLKLILAICCSFGFALVLATETEPCNCNGSIFGATSYLKNEGCAKPVWGWDGFKYVNGTRDCCRQAISPNPPGCYQSQEHACCVSATEN